MTEVKPLTTEHIRVLKTLCEKYPDSDIARAIATIEQQREQIEKLRVVVAKAEQAIEAAYSSANNMTPEYLQMIESAGHGCNEALAATDPQR